MIICVIIAVEFHSLAQIISLKMVAFSFFAVVLFCSMVKISYGAAWDRKMSSLDTVKWLCENYPHASARVFSSKEVAGGDAVYYCKLTFPVKIRDEDDAFAYCWMRLQMAVISSITDGSNLHCTYEIWYLCPPGQIPYRNVCIKYHEQPLNLADAKKECGKSGGFLPWTIVNPRLFGFNIRTVWSISSRNHPYRYVMARGLEGNMPGAQISSDGSESSSFACLHYGMKTYRVYEEECKIYKKTFKLTAYFHQGTCYIMSPSVYLKAKAHDLHQYCQWLSDNDRVVTPVSGVRRDGIDKTLEGSIFQYNYALTTGEKKKDSAGDVHEGWQVIDPDQTKLVEIFRGVWSKGRPVKDTDGTPNLQAVVMPKKKRTTQGVLYDVPKFFRGHPVCAIGVTPQDNVFKACDKGWRSVTRDNGRVMCAKAFTKELELKNYEQSTQFCQTFGAVLAPMEGAEEQELILKLMDEANPAKNGAMWLGAKRNPSIDRTKFFWAIDNSELRDWAANWSKDEPNDVGGVEDCLQIYTGGPERPRGKWNDIHCTLTSSTQGDEIKGGVCAKYHSLE